MQNYQFGLLENCKNNMNEHPICRNDTFLAATGGYIGVYTGFAIFMKGGAIGQREPPPFKILI